MSLLGETCERSRGQSQSEPVQDKIANCFTTMLSFYLQRNLEFSHLQLENPDHQVLFELLTLTISRQFKIGTCTAS